MKKVLVFIFLIHLSINLTAQKLEGIYSLNNFYKYGYGNSYLKFSGTKFWFFHFIGDQTMLSGDKTQIEYVGTGNFNVKNNTLDLNFNTDTNLVVRKSKDTITTNFFSTNDKSINFFFKLKFITTDQSCCYTVKVHTSKTDYSFNSSNNEDTFKIKTPSNISILSISLKIRGYYEIELPYNNRFNNTSYNYTVNDELIIAQMKKEKKWEFKIKPIVGSNNFKLNNSKSLWLEKINNDTQAFFDKEILVNGQLEAILKSKN